jgi:hypothetical protein
MRTVLELKPPPLPEFSPPTLASVLAEIAETLELQEVFERVATSIRRLILLDNMGVVRILGRCSAVLHATTVPARPCRLPPPPCRSSSTSLTHSEPAVFGTHRRARSGK